ncbi:MAG: aminotransferase class V-fold PLP-dependent enzyme [Armatimonadetes bacterium]|nr:aminotransferase class V-fold PLP-dependent enzyme [Armatimonadota bacterium]
MNEIQKALKKFSQKNLKFLKEALEETKIIREKIKETGEFNQLKIIQAFQECKVTDECFWGSTGYGLDDFGRERLDNLAAKIFKAESALVRFNFVSGTHALNCAFLGILKPNEELLSISGKPYDTLLPLIDNLNTLGIKYKELELNSKGEFDYLKIKEKIDSKTKLIFIQRSCGYSFRRSIKLLEIKKVISFIKKIKNDLIILVDNCYGELVEEKEPIEAGADLCAGSLIKNLGGGIAPGGGYLAGSKDLIHKASFILTAPGLGGKLGATLGINRLLFQGLFYAPLIVTQALQGAVLASYIFENMGLKCIPRWNEHRTDIIQAVKLGSAEKLKTFCKAVQNAGVINSQVIPEAVIQPGYKDPVIMAGGTFIQGSSIEFSADGAMRPPYIAYLQGGILPQIKLGILMILEELEKIK